MITPVLRVHDVDLSLRFYTHVLGFKGEGGLPGIDGKSVYAEAYLGDARVMFARRPPVSIGNICAAELYIQLNTGIDELYRRLRAREVPICHDLHEEIWGDQAFTIVDLDGNRISFAQRITYAAQPAALPVKLQQIA